MPMGRGHEHDSRKYFYEKECDLLNKKLHNFTSCTPQTFSAPQEEVAKENVCPVSQLTVSTQAPLIKFTFFSVLSGLRNVIGIESRNLMKA